MKALIISKNFSPAFISHMMAYYKLFVELGFETYFLVDERYVLSEEIGSLDKYIIQDEDINKKGFDIAIICNVSIKHIAVAKKLNKRTKKIYVFHEPDFGLFRKKESANGKARLFAASICSMIIARLSDMIVLPSQCAVKAYKKNFYWCNKNWCYLPLLYDDEMGDDKVNLSVKKKEYCSFLGTALIAHNFDVFLDFVRYSKRNNMGLKFYIATKSNIDEYLENDKLLDEMINKKELVIRAGHPLTNEEMNECYLKSYCIWNAYACSTQSGVLPRAYMAGTAVVATRVGSFLEFVKGGDNGEFIDPKNFDDIMQHVLKIRENKVSYSKKCRAEFLSAFYYRAQCGTMKKILKKLTSN